MQSICKMAPVHDQYNQNRRKQDKLTSSRSFVSGLPKKSRCMLVRSGSHCCAARTHAVCERCLTRLPTPPTVATCCKVDAVLTPAFSAWDSTQLAKARHGSIAVAEGMSSTLTLLLPTPSCHVFIASRHRGSARAMHTRHQPQAASSSAELFACPTSSRVPTQVPNACLYVS